MRAVFLSLGFALLVALVLWIALYAVSPETAIEVIGKGFTEPTFSDTANATLSRAEAARDAAIREFRLWNFISQVAGWITLAASSVVTITAGLLGRPETEQPSSVRPARLYLIGGLGALSSVATLSGAYAKDIGQTARTDAIEIARVIRRTAETLKAAPDQEALLLSELDATLRMTER
jgi:hypothetical protein